MTGIQYDRYFLARRPSVKTVGSGDNNPYDCLLQAMKFCFGLVIIVDPGRSFQKLLDLNTEFIDILFSNVIDILAAYV